MNREEMTRQMQEIGFYLVELNLFLDTHPEDSPALATYNAYAEELAKLRKQYFESYGPVTNFGNQPAGDSFKWVNAPWPWEK